MKRTIGLFGAATLMLVTAAHAQTIRPRPVPKSDASRWIANDDYPKEARRQHLSGVVSYVLTVSPEGVPTHCDVTTDTPPLLNEATCRLLLRHARFLPATDAKGDPVESDYRSLINWQFPR